MKKQKIEGKVTMFQIVANHEKKLTQVTTIATLEDLYLMWGVAFENDPNLLHTMQKIINLYREYKDEQN